MARGKLFGFLPQQVQKPCAKYKPLVMGGLVSRCRLQLGLGNRRKLLSRGGAFGTHEWIIPKRNMITIFMVACDGECSALPERAFQQMVASSVQ